MSVYIDFTAIVYSFEIDIMAWSGCAGRPVSRAVLNTVSVNIAFFILDDYFRLYTTVVTLSASKSTDSPADTAASVSFLLLVVV